MSLTLILMCNFVSGPHIFAPHIFCMGWSYLVLTSIIWAPATTTIPGIPTQYWHFLSSPGLSRFRVLLSSGFWVAFQVRFLWTLSPFGLCYQPYSHIYGRSILGFWPSWGFLFQTPFVFWPSDSEPTDSECFLTLRSKSGQSVADFRHLFEYCLQNIAFLGSWFYSQRSMDFQDPWASLSGHSGFLPLKSFRTLWRRAGASSCLSTGRLLAYSPAFALTSLVKGVLQASDYIFEWSWVR